jgi:hypothetical protein
MRETSPHKSRFGRRKSFTPYTTHGRARGNYRHAFSTPETVPSVLGQQLAAFSEHRRHMRSEALTLDGKTKLRPASFLLRELL